MTARLLWHQLQHGHFTKFSVYELIYDLMANYGYELWVVTLANTNSQKILSSHDSFARRWGHAWSRTAAF